MPQDNVTRSDIREIIDGWEEKFNKLTDGVRALEQGTHEVHMHMHIVMRENRARKSAQLATNRQIKLIQEGLPHFMETCDPAHHTPIRTFVQPCAPKMSTAITPSRAPPKFRSEFSFASPVNQTTPVEPTRGDGGRDLNERPTHENGNGNGSDTQQLTMNTSSGLNNTATRHSSSPKVPIFDGTVSAHFRPWLIQFEPNAGRPGKKWTDGRGRISTTNICTRIWIIGWQITGMRGCG